MVDSADSAGSERLSQQVELDWSQAAGDRFPEFADVAGFGDSPGLIVGDDGDEWEVLAYGGFEVCRVEGERTVAGEKNDGSRGKCQAGGHGTAESPAYDSTAAAGEPIARIVVV